MLMTNTIEQEKVIPYWNEVKVLIAAAEYALKESRAGRCMPNSDVKSYIYQKRGWK